ncbi:amino acid permease [Microbacterium rhizomatis]|uniref:Amino acid permease n=1 Tax=Microbacterium rhizomatis TaxID=1631477 RepID=A0A5J5J2J7_9MICO|nr:amino acid permease [Microbacterium rhizomatis]KAA9106528.1 amino acid permease [Microbacterium rhizomatis]
MSQSRSDARKVAGATYARAGDGYFEKRTLKRSAGVWGLWGLAVAAVISGDFSGWNFGIDFAGFGGMLIAFIILVAMYYGMIFSIGEMAAAMPHTGGAYSFARSAMGPWGGLVTGAAETIEYVATTAVIVYFSASYANAITSELLGFDLSADGANMMWVWYVVLYLAFVLLNAAGASISFKFAIVVSIISIGIIVVFSVMALASGAFQWANLWDMVPDPGQTEFLPHGVFPILFALPFAMWFFLGIEELPLAAEESHNPVRDIPKAGFWARGTLIVTGLLVLFLNTGVIGAEATGVAGEPLLDGFRAIVGDELAAVLALLALVGLLASLQGIMFAYGRNMYSLSRAGYYPRFLSLTGKRQTPWVALVVGAAIGFIALVVLDVLAAVNEGAGAVAGAIVLNIAVWGAVLAYLLQMVSFIILRKKLPNVERPYLSPWGIPGAVIAAVIAALIFVGFLLNPTFGPAIIAIAIVYVVILIGFAVFFRHRLVLSPEEEYALSGGTHGDPQTEGYDAMEKDVFGDRV